MNRIFGTVVTLVWLLAMAALIQRDVLPFWQAQDPPGHAVPTGDFQVAIMNEAGQRVGTTWVQAFRKPNRTVYSTTRLDLGTVAKVLSTLGPMFLDSSLTYADGGGLKEFLFQLRTAGLSARVEGFLYGHEYACAATIGGMTRAIALNGELSKYLGDSIRPFSHLEGLRVGQTWRIRLLDPLSLVRNQSLEFSTRLVTVRRRERIQHRGRAVSCFRIETEGAVAWADGTGRILRQEVTIPFVGKLMLLDEPFDEAAYRRAKRAAHTLHPPGLPGDWTARRAAERVAPAREKARR